MTIGTRRRPDVTVRPAGAVYAQMERRHFTVMAFAAGLRHVLAVNGRSRVLGGKDRRHIAGDGVTIGTAGTLCVNADIERRMSVLMKLLAFQVWQCFADAVAALAAQPDAGRKLGRLLVRRHVLLSRRRLGVRYCPTIIKGPYKHNRRDHDGGGFDI